MTEIKYHAKAAFLLFGVALVWGFFILFTPFGWFQLGLLLVCLVLSWLRYPVVWLTEYKPWHNLLMLKYDKIRHQLNSWCFTLWLSNDQYINSVFRGMEDHSISGRVGYLAMNGNPVAMVMEKVIDFLFWIFAGQRNHCRESIEFDEVK